MSVRLYTHLTWTTLSRRPLIHPALAAFLGRSIPVIARRYGAQVHALGVVGDHIHVILELPPRVDIPQVVQAMKGATARIANRDGLMERGPLRWARGYDLRSVGVRDLRRATAYVEHQAERHPDQALPPEPG